MKDFRVVVLGSRGSAPLEGEIFSYYGGATSCIYVSVAGQNIVLDGGSGMMLLPDVLGNCKDMHLLLSHPHIDHIMGIMCCPMMFRPDIDVTIYAKEHEKMGAKAQINSAMHRPLWPVRSDAFCANVKYITCKDEFFIGDVKVSCLRGSHPGGSTIYRLDYGQKSLVYATDHELTEQNSHELESFANGCTLLLCDGQYLPTEVNHTRGYGHSSWENAAKVGVNCGAENLGIIHHSPFRTDEQLQDLERALQEIFPGGFFARMKGETCL